MPKKGQGGDTPALQKARQVRAQRTKAERDEAIWHIIEPELSACNCGLEKGMTLDELRPLGAGCTQGHGYQPGWVCSTLDRYRRLLEGAWSGYNKKND